MNIWRSVRRSGFPGAAGCSFSGDDPCQFRTEDGACIIIDQTEAVAVVGGAQVVPDTVADVVFLEQGDDVAPPRPCKMKKARSPD